MSIGNLQFFIQMPWKSALSKTKSMPRSRGSEGRNIRPIARSSSLTITSTCSTLPEGRVSGTTAGARHGPRGEGERRHGARESRESHRFDRTTRAQAASFLTGEPSRSRRRRLSQAPASSSTPSARKDSIR